MKHPQPLHYVLVAAIAIAWGSVTPAQNPVRTARVAASAGCPELGPIDAWAHRNLKEHIDNTVFCGDFDSDGRADAIAFVNHALGGNNQGHDVVLFRNVGGTLRFLRRVFPIAGEPNAAAFSPGKVMLDMTTMLPEDPRCCPSGRTRVVVNVASGTHNQSH